MMCYNGQGAETGRYFYHRDGLGSVVALSQLSASTVQIVESYAYDIHGRVTLMDSAGADGRWLTPDVTSLAASAIGNPYLFTGRRYDGETRAAGHSGLYYYRARVYHPDLMRFCQPDPIGYADSLNLYAYCLNNPLVFVDPWGLCTRRDEQPWGVGVLGHSVTAGVGGGGTAGYQVVIDSDGRFGVVATIGGGGYFGFGAAVARDISVFRGSVHDLGGPGGVVGGGGNIGVVAVGADYFAGEKAVGGTFHAGAGIGRIPFEMHGFGTHSWVAASPWTVKDVIQGVKAIPSGVKARVEQMKRNHALTRRIYETIDEYGLE